MAPPRWLPRPCRSRLPWISALVVVGAATVGCRSGAAPRPGAPAAPPDVVRSYVGQVALLRHRGDVSKWSLDQKAVARQAEICDVAVEVKDASFQNGVVQLRLEHLGHPRSEGWRGRCRRQVAEIVLRITGFPHGASADVVRSVIGRLLQTPEAWLAVQGIRFDLPPSPGAPKFAADRSTVAAEADMRLARDVTRWPRRLLWIEPTYSDPGKVKHEGEIEIAVIVGPDGRAYRPQVRTPLDEAHQRRIDRTCALWRFEPARKGSEPVAARVTERTVLRVY